MNEEIITEGLQSEEMTDTPSKAPADQQTHRPILKVDRTAGAATTASRHFLLPVDDTEDSELAIQWAVDNTYRSGDIFHLLHVIPEPKMVHIWSGVYIPPDEDAELVEVEDTKEFVKHRFAAKLINAKVPFQLHVIVGPTDAESVAHVVAKKATDLKAEAIVVGKHSKGKLKEYWVGSVTKTLVKMAPCPVAVVPHM